MKTIILVNFKTISEGVEYMSNTSFPSYFSVGVNWEDWYSKDGNLMSGLEEQKLPTIILNDTHNSDLNNINTDLTNLIEGEYYYNGEYIFTI